MPHPSFDLREFFHLSLLRHLGVRLSGRNFAVKGGICLRFFHRSPRLSEDMDLDIDPQVRVRTLQNTVESILHSRSFLNSLVSLGIPQIEVRRTKQTETTQRWKILLFLGRETPLSTKVEFSRRQGEIFYSQGIVDAELLSYYKLPPFATQFYDAISMTAQKIGALASPSRYAVRDLFDLHHLFLNLRVNAQEIHKQMKPVEIEKAIDKAGTFTYLDFKEQVLPFLSEEMMNLYRAKESFDKLKNEVEQSLIQNLP